MNMSVMGISGPPPEIPAVVSDRDRTDRKIIIVVIALFVVLFVGGIGAFVAVTAHYAARYGNIDHSHESLSWDPSISQAASTTFESPGYGITLKLPGRWDSMKQTPNVICRLLRADRRFNVLVRPYFPSFSPPGSVSAQIARRFQSQGWIVKGENSITVSGLPADEIQLVTPKGAEVDELVIQKVPVVYFVALSGPASDAESWQLLRDALPQSITIR